MDAAALPSPAVYWLARDGVATLSRSCRSRRLRREWQRGPSDMHPLPRPPSGRQINARDRATPALMIVSEFTASLVKCENKSDGLIWGDKMWLFLAIGSVHTEWVCEGTPGCDKWSGVKGSARAACPPVCSLHHFWASLAFARRHNNSIVILWGSRGPNHNTLHLLREDRANCRRQAFLFLTPSSISDDGILWELFSLPSPGPPGGGGVPTRSRVTN